MKKMFSLTVIVAMSGSAMARGYLPGEALQAGPDLSGAASAPDTGARVGVPVPLLDVAGIASFDGRGSVGNTVIEINLGPGAVINGIGWDVVLQADDPSLLSDITVSIGDSSGNDFLFIRPGAGSNFSGGPTAFTSDGVIKLADAGLPDIVLANGILQIEFFETFDDAAGSVDGSWISGQFFTQYIPTPGVVSLVCLAGVAIASRRWR